MEDERNLLESPTEQDGDFILADQEQPTESIPRIDKELDEDGTIALVDGAYRKWLQRRGWTKGRPPMPGEDPEYDSMVAHFKEAAAEKARKKSVRQRCIEYILGKRKEKHEIRTATEAVREAPADAGGDENGSRLLVS